MVEQKTVFCAQFFSGHILCPKYGHVQAHHWIFQSAQSEKVVAWNKSHPTTSSNTYAQHVALEVHALALSLMR